VGFEVAQIRLGVHDIQIRLHPDHCIHVEGRIPLLDAKGVELDGREPAEIAGETRLGRLLDDETESFGVRSSTTGRFPNRDRTVGATSSGAYSSRASPGCQRCVRTSVKDVPEPDRHTSSTRFELLRPDE
jgi:hypothetical protein